MKRFVRAIIINSEQQGILVINEEREMETWNFPGGKVEFGENYHDACVREVFEEIAINVLDCNLLFEQEFKLDNEVWHGYYYVVSDYTGSILIKENNCKEYRYANLSEIFNSSNQFLSVAGNYIQEMIANN